METCPSCHSPRVLPTVYPDPAQRFCVQCHRMWASDSGDLSHVAMFQKMRSLCGSPESPVAPQPARTADS
jgi:hypothetical protein